jgi:hypothetical protein
MVVRDSRSVQQPLRSLTLREMQLCMGVSSIPKVESKSIPLILSIESVYQRIVMEIRPITVISLHRCAMITIVVFFGFDECFCKIHTSKRARILTCSKLHTSAIECKEGLCNSRLVDFELLLELKIEQNKGNSVHTSRETDATSLKQSETVCARTERLSVPVIYFYITPWFHSDLTIILYKPASLISLLRDEESSE